MVSYLPKKQLPEAQCTQLMGLLRVRSSASCTRDNFSSYVTFMHTFVSKHWLITSVTDRVDVRNVCTHLLINVDEVRSSTSIPAFPASISAPFGTRPIATKNSIVALSFSWCFLAFPMKRRYRLLSLQLRITLVSSIKRTFLDTLSEDFNDIAVPWRG